MRRERAPFVLTPEFANVMGCKGSDNFNRFIDLCVQGYNILRRHANVFINLFAMVCARIRHFEALSNFICSPLWFSSRCYPQEYLNYKARATSNISDKHWSWTWPMKRLGNISVNWFKRVWILALHKWCLSHTLWPIQTKNYFTNNIFVCWALRCTWDMNWKQKQFQWQSIE